MTTPSGRHFVPLRAPRPAELEDVGAALRDARRRADDARREVELLRATVVPRLEGRALELERRLEASEAGRAAAQRALDDTLGSSSWRLTRPLRAAMDALRGRSQETPRGSRDV